MSNRKFYRTVIQVEVLSEEPYEFIGLNQVTYDIAGDCSGSTKVVSNEVVDGKRMADLLLEQGSDPEFFQLNEDGSDVTEDEDLGKCFPVEWDREFTGGNYSSVGDIAYVPFSYLDKQGDEEKQVARAFEKHTGVNPIHIIHYTFDEVYDSEGEEWPEDDDNKWIGLNFPQ